MHLFPYLLSISLLISTTFISCEQPNPLIVRVENGLIQGKLNTEGDVRIFQSIPFAAPPVGELRWKAPQPVQDWEGVLSCTSFGPSPVQGKPSPFMFWSSEFLIPEAPIDEDCLHLNVWTGAKTAEEKKAVLVYIYGGGFRSGGSACPIYDGEAMAKKDVVFVSINYRVGVFGFLAHPDLTEEAPYAASGNYALLDMIAALKWVKSNIATFGGDPDNITIAGQSAGAFGVNFLTASPLAKGLFHRAIAQSGGAVYSRPGSPIPDLRTAEEAGKRFVENMGGSSIEELRQKSADEILQATGDISWPNIDGYLLPRNIYDVYKKGEQNDVSLMVGWNGDDKLFPAPVAPQIFKDRIENRFGDMAEAFFDVYPNENEEVSAQSQSDMNRDEMFGIQGYGWAKMQTKTGKSDAYIYQFNRKLPAHTPETQFGAFHSGEVVYAYNNLHTLDRPWEPIDQKIADMMSSYWVNFAKTGNPNGDELPEWEPYSPEEEKVMVIDTISISMALPSKDKLTFWEKYFSSSSE